MPLRVSHFPCLPVLLASVFLALAGCSSTPDPTRTYVLAPPAADATSPVPDKDAVVLALRPPELPEFLLTKRIALRKGPHEIIYSDLHQWAQPLAPAVNDVLAQNLARSPRVTKVHRSPWSDRLRPDNTLRLRLSEFEGSLDGTVRVRADWSVYDSEKDLLLSEGSHNCQGLKWTPGDFNSLSQALAAGLTEVAGAVGKTL